MTDVRTARLFQNGRSQVVRLPCEFRFEGDRVRVRWVGRGVLLEPLFSDVAGWFAELDQPSAAHGPFMPDGPDGAPGAQRRDDGGLT